MGVYWKTAETLFLTKDFEDEDQMLNVMQALFNPDEDLIQDYKEYYLLQPIHLNARLKQVTQALALEKEAEYQLSLEVDEFSILLQKTQYDNIMKLMELFSDF